MEMVLNSWPELSNYVPDDAFRFEWDTGCNGYCTHPEIASFYWVRSTGGKEFNIEPFPLEYYGMDFLADCRVPSTRQRVLTIKSVPR